MGNNGSFCDTFDILLSETIFDFAYFPCWEKHLHELSQLVQPEQWDNGTDSFYVLSNYLQKYFVSVQRCHKRFKNIIVFDGQKNLYVNINLISKKSPSDYILMKFARNTHSTISKPFVFSRFVIGNAAYWDDQEKKVLTSLEAIDFSKPREGESSEDEVDVFEDIFHPSIMLYSSIDSISNEIERTLHERNDELSRRLLNESSDVDSLGQLTSCIKQALFEARRNRSRVVPCVDHFDELSLLIPVAVPCSSEPTFCIMLKRALKAECRESYVAQSRRVEYMYDYLYVGCLSLEQAYIRARLYNTVESYWLKQGFRQIASSHTVANVPSTGNVVVVQADGMRSESRKHEVQMLTPVDRRPNVDLAINTPSPVNLEASLRVAKSNLKSAVAGTDVSASANRSLLASAAGEVAPPVGPGGEYHVNPRLKQEHIDELNRAIQGFQQRVAIINSAVSEDMDYKMKCDVSTHLPFSPNKTFDRHATSVKSAPATTTAMRESLLLLMSEDEAASEFIKSLDISESDCDAEDVARSSSSHRSLAVPSAGAALAADGFSSHERRSLGLRQGTPIRVVRNPSSTTIQPVSVSAAKPSASLVIPVGLSDFYDSPSPSPAAAAASEKLSGISKLNTQGNAGIEQMASSRNTSNNLTSESAETVTAGAKGTSSSGLANNNNVSTSARTDNLKTLSTAIESTWMNKCPDQARDSFMAEEDVVTLDLNGNSFYKALAYEPANTTDVGVSATRGGVFAKPSPSSLDEKNQPRVAVAVAASALSSESHDPFKTRLHAVSVKNAPETNSSPKRSQEMQKATAALQAAITGQTSSSAPQQLPSTPVRAATTTPTTSSPQRVPVQSPAIRAAAEAAFATPSKLPLSTSSSVSTPKTEKEKRKKEKHAPALKERVSLPLNSESDLSKFQFADNSTHKLIFPVFTVIPFKSNDHQSTLLLNTTQGSPYSTLSVTSPSAAPNTPNPPSSPATTSPQSLMSPGRFVLSRNKSQSVNVISNASASRIPVSLSRFGNSFRQATSETPSSVDDRERRLLVEDESVRDQQPGDPIPPEVVSTDLDSRSLSRLASSPSNAVKAVHTAKSSSSSVGGNSWSNLKFKMLNKFTSSPREMTSTAASIDESNNNSSRSSFTFSHAVSSSTRHTKATGGSASKKSFLNKIIGGYSTSSNKSQAKDSHTAVDPVADRDQLTSKSINNGTRLTAADTAGGEHSASAIDISKVHSTSGESLEGGLAATAKVDAIFPKHLMWTANPAQVNPHPGDHPFYSYEDLVQNKIEGLVCERKEDYLDDDTFADKFGMDRKQFAALPSWKKDAKKKILGLHSTSSGTLPTIVRRSSGGGPAAAGSFAVDVPPPMGSSMTSPKLSSSLNSKLTDRWTKFLLGTPHSASPAGPNVTSSSSPVSNNSSSDSPHYGIASGTVSFKNSNQDSYNKQKVASERRLVLPVGHSDKASIGSRQQTPKRDDIRVSPPRPPAADTAQTPTFIVGNKASSLKTNPLGRLRSGSSFRVDDPSASDFIPAEEAAGDGVHFDADESGKSQQFEIIASTEDENPLLNSTRRVLHLQGPSPYSVSQNKATPAASRLPLHSVLLESQQSIDEVEESTRSNEDVDFVYPNHDIQAVVSAAGNSAVTTLSSSTIESVDTIPACNSEPSIPFASLSGVETAAPATSTKLRTPQTSSRQLNSRFSDTSVNNVNAKSTAITRLRSLCINDEQLTASGKSDGESVTNPRIDSSKSVRTIQYIKSSSSKKLADDSFASPLPSSTTQSSSTLTSSGNNSSRLLSREMSISECSEEMKECDADEINDPAFPVHSLEELKMNACIDIDIKHKEMYLSNKAFFKQFGMRKEQFITLPKWKKDLRKKEIGLF